MTSSSARASRPTGRRSGSGSSEPQPPENGGSEARRGANRGRPKRRRPPARRLFRFDRSFGCRFVAGADEAGRGSLAGPLVAAAVRIDLERLGRAERRALAWLDDSKGMGHEEREALYAPVLRAASAASVAVRSVRAIDGRGLHVSNLDALRQCLQSVACDGATCLVDGFALPDCEVEHTAVVEGDSRSAAIAAASIVAKVTRDRFMHRADALYPGWGFAANVGYSTPEHRDAIAALGISPLHRRSFASVAYTQLDLDLRSGAADPEAAAQAAAALAEEVEELERGADEVERAA